MDQDSQTNQDTSTPELPTPPIQVVSSEPQEEQIDDQIVVQPTLPPTNPIAPPESAQPEEGADIEIEEIEDEEPTANKAREGIKSTFTTIFILIAAPLVAVLLTTFVFQSYEVDGESMETALQNNDRLIVWKAPATFARMTSGDYIPNRGQIIIFHKVESAEVSVIGERQLIKRVIGLPGERVVVDNNEATVYNTEHPEGFNPDTSGLYTITAAITPGTVDITVPEGEVFVMGDNRTNSLDSRVLGTIRSDEIIGQLSFRIFPFIKAKHY